MIILGIETSCDETALALIETREIAPQNNKDSEIKSNTEYRVIQSLVHSQAELHSAYGGVFPTLAKREHSKNLLPLLEKILKDLPSENQNKNSSPQTKVNFTQILESFQKQYGEQNSDLLESFKHAKFLENIYNNPPKIDCIAVTEGPGLEPALWVGITFARMLGESLNIPVIPVNHMEGHVVGSLLDDDKPYGSWQKLKTLTMPSVAFLISGGHTELIKIEGSKNIGKNFEYTLLGQTRDDAVGEAFDKVARLLGLSYPGGPHISKLSDEAYEEKIESPIKLPRSMINSKDLDFSFSGLKTAVLYAVRDAQKSEQKNGAEDNILSENFKKGLAHEFEQSISDVLDAKLRQAIENIGAQSIVIGGGVSANHVLRKRFQKIAEDYNIPIFMPSQHLSGDNALMIALVGALNASIIREIRADGTQKLSS